MQSNVESMHDTDGEHFVKARCSRNRLWSRIPLCWFKTCMSACLENLQKEILSTKICVEIVVYGKKHIRAKTTTKKKKKKKKKHIIPRTQRFYVIFKSSFYVILWYAIMNMLTE